MTIIRNDIRRKTLPARGQCTVCGRYPHSDRLFARERRGGLVIRQHRHNVEDRTIEVSTQHICGSCTRDLAAFLTADLRTTRLTKARR